MNWGRKQSSCDPQKCVQGNRKPSATTFPPSVLGKGSRVTKGQLQQLRDMTCILIKIVLGRKNFSLWENYSAAHLWSHRLMVVRGPPCSFLCLVCKRCAAFPLTPNCGVSNCLCHILFLLATIKMLLFSLCLSNKCHYCVLQAFIYDGWVIHRGSW